MTYVGMAAKVEIAFVANPYSSTLVWTDVTSRVVKLKTTTGRNYETGKNESSTVGVELRNNDGALNPMNTASPFYPYVLPFRPIRVTSTVSTTTTTTMGTGTSYPGALYPGTTAPGTTTATGSGTPTTTTTTGPTYPTWYGYVSSFPQSVKDQTSQYEMVQVVGVDAFKAVLGFVPGDPYDVKVRKDYGAYTAPGLTASQWDFYSFDEAAAPFASENTLNNKPLTVPSGATGPTKMSPSPCRTAISFNGSQSLYSNYALGSVGEVWFNPTVQPSGPGVCAIIIAGSSIGAGNAVGNCFLSGIPTSTVLILEQPIGATGQDASVSVGVALVTNYVNVMPSNNSTSFETSVVDWTSESPANMTIAQSTVNPAYGTGAMRASVLAAAGGIISLTTRAPVTAGYYYNASLSYAASSTNPTVVISFRWYSSTGTLLTTTAGAANPAAVGGGAYQTATSGSRLAPTGATTVSVFITVGMSSGTTAAVDFDGISLYGAATQAGITNLYHMAYVPPSAGATSSLFAKFDNSAGTYVLPAPALGMWHHVAFAPSYNTGVPTVFSFDGVAQTPVGTVAGGVVGAISVFGSMSTLGVATPKTFFTGQMAGLWLMTPATGLNNVNAAYATQHYNYGTTSSGGARTHDFSTELTSSRVTSVLTAIGFPTAMASLETGLTAMTASGNVSGVTATNLLVAAAEAELGNVFVDRNGVVTFHNRAHRNSPTTAATFGGDGNIPYEGNLVIGFDDTYIYNDVQVTQAATNPAYVFEAQDLTSQNVYGVRTQQATIQVTAQSDVQGMAATLLGRYKDPRPRLATLSVELRSKPQYVGQVFGLHIGDLITINHRPPGGTMFSLQCFIDGVSHTVDEGQWLVTFNTTPFYPNTTY